MRSCISGLFAGASLFASVSALSQSGAFGQKLYGITFFGGDLVTVDPLTGEAASVGILDVAVAGYGLAPRYGRLYSFDATTDRIVEINPSTGKVLRSLEVGLPNLTGEGDIAFRADGTGFLSTALSPDGSPSSEVYTFDVIGRSSRKLGSPGIVLDAMAFGPDGQLYALGQGEGLLYRIDQQSGTATEIGSLGTDQNSPFAAMAFAPSGTLYLSLDDRLWTVDTATGAATEVNAEILGLGFSSVSGLAFLEPEQAFQLYGLTYFGGNIVKVAADGSAEVDETARPPIHGYGLARHAGSLYTYDPNADRIVEVKGSTVSATGSFPIGAGNLTGEGDLAFRSDGIGFLASALSPELGVSSDLITFNLGQGTSTRIGTTTVPVDALAFDAQDNLFALGQGEGILYQVNQRTAEMVPVGNLGVPQNSPFAALSFAPDGTLYGVIDDRLFVLDPARGTAVPADPKVLDIGFSSVSGLAFLPKGERLAYAFDAAGLALYWTGPDFILETTDRLGAPWVRAANQENPQRAQMDSRDRYFRLRR